MDTKNKKYISTWLWASTKRLAKMVAGALGVSMSEHIDNLVTTDAQVRGIALPDETDQSKEDTKKGE